MKKAGATLICWLSGALAFAQPQDLVTEAERRQAALAILLLVIFGLLLTYGLLRFLRWRGLIRDLPAGTEEEPLAEQIARRVDEAAKSDNEETTRC